MIEFRSISKSAATHHDALCFAAPKMAEYMMDRAKRLDFLFYGTGLSREECERHYPSDWEELQTILSILKDAGIDIVKDGKR